jgi:hypothetical protein
MPAHERRPDQPLDAYLCRILLAIAKQNGGEVRVKEDAIEIDTRQLLVRDFDSATGEIIFRVASRYAEPIWVEPVQSAWTIPFEERARQLGLAEPSRSHIPTDEELAAKEQQRNLRRQTRPIAPPTPTA